MNIASIVRHHRLSLLAAGLLSVSLGSHVSAQSAGGSGANAGRAVQGAPIPSVLPARLSDVEGGVQVVQLTAPAAFAAPDQVLPGQISPGQIPPPPPDTPTTEAVVNMPVLAGMQVETGNDGRAELEFSDGSVARVTPNSAVSVLVLNGSGEQLQAVRGLSYFEVGAQTAGTLSVQVGPDQAGLVPDSLVRVNLDSTPYLVSALRGSAFVHEESSGVGFVLAAGQTATLDPTSPTAYDLKTDLAADSWDTWNDDRDGALAEMAGVETNARVGNGAPDAQAWNDLDYYGTWYNVPGQGMAWAPDGVDASFDPYGSGSWGFYSGIGPTWISAYPWGWLPYRCGAWNYFDSFGWGWQPGGGCLGFGGLGWHPYAGVRHAPRSYRLPQPPFLPRTHYAGIPVIRPASSGAMLAYGFRQPGSARPAVRSFALSAADSANGEAAFAPVLPLESRLAVQTRLSYRSGYGGSAGSGLQGNHILGGHVMVHPVAPAVRPGVAPPPAPRGSYAAPVRVAPAPAAPHVAAPAAAHGH